MGGAHKHNNMTFRDSVARLLKDAKKQQQQQQQQQQKSAKITLKSFSNLFFGGSQPISHGPDDVQQVHLAVTNDPTQMRVTFATGITHLQGGL